MELFHSLDLGVLPGAGDEQLDPSLSFRQQLLVGEDKLGFRLLSPSRNDFDGALDARIPPLQARQAENRGFQKQVWCSDRIVAR